MKIIRNPSPILRTRQDQTLNTINSCSPSCRSYIGSSLQNLNPYMDKQFQSVQQQVRSRSRQRTRSPNNNTKSSDILKQNQNVQNYYSQPTDQDNQQQYKIIQYTNNPTKENRKELCESIVKQYLNSDNKNSTLIKSNQILSQHLPSQLNSAQKQNQNQDESLLYSKCNQLQQRVFELESKLKHQNPQDSQKLQLQNTKLSNENINLQKAIKEKEKQLSAYKETIIKLDSQLQLFQGQIETQKKDINDLNQILKQKNVQVKSLTVQINQLTRNHQGYSNTTEEVPFLQAAKEQIEQALSLINVQNSIIKDYQARQNSIKPKEFEQNLSLSTIKGENTNNEIQDEHLHDSNIRKCYGVRPITKHESVDSIQKTQFKDESITDIITNNLKKRFQN